jgi:hypothetical protein
MDLSPALLSPLPADMNYSPISLLSPTSDHPPPPLVTDCQETSATSQLAEGTSMDLNRIGDSLLNIASSNSEHISPHSATDCRGASTASQSAKETSPTSTSIVWSPDIVGMDCQGVLPSSKSANKESPDISSTAESSTSLASSTTEHFPFILATEFQGAPGSQPMKWISFNLITQKANQGMSNAPPKLHENAATLDKGDVGSSEPTSGDLQVE